MYLYSAKHNELIKMFNSPFEKITNKTEKKLTFSLIYLLIITLLAMRYFNGFLENTISPNGIIDFELARTLERTQEVLDSWSSLAKIFAGLSLGFDFLFLLIYTLFISLIIHKLNERLWIGKPFHRVGGFLIWSMFITAIFDAIENVCLIKLLVGNMEQFWATLAFYFASTKFILIIISVLYVLGNAVLLLVKKRS